MKAKKERLVRALETSPENEWYQVKRDAAKDSAKLFKAGKSWLKKNKDRQVAGEAFARLIEINAEEQLISGALAWLDKFPKNRSRYELIGVLLNAAPSLDLERLAIESMNDCKELFLLKTIIRASIEIPSLKSLYRNVEALLESNPSDSSWEHTIITRRKDSAHRAHKLIARWLQLNVDNPEIFIIPHTTLATSPEVIEAAYDWLGRGGKTNEYMPFSVGDLIGQTTKYHKPFLRKSLNFARNWLLINPDNKESGMVYGEIIWATKTKADCSKARLWHKQHINNESAWFVLARLLEIAAAEQKQPGKYEISQARTFLSSPSNRLDKPRLIGALLDVIVDEETIGWAEEKYQRNGYMWMLAKLIRQAPSGQLVREGERTVDEWRGSSFELPMLKALLKSGYKSALAIKCARTWVQNNPKHRDYKAIAALTQSARNLRSAQ